MRKRIISIMLVISMVLMYVPTTAFAAGIGGTYTKIEGTGQTNIEEKAEKLLDGKVDTKWCVTGFSNETKASVTFQTSSAVNVSGYSITTGNDNLSERGRNPKSWTLFGCNDYNTDTKNGSWTTIHSVTNDTVLEDKNFETYNYVFEKSGTAYQYFKLEITEIQSGDVMQMSEFALTSCDHKWSTPVTTERTCTIAGYTRKTCSICQGEYIYDYQAQFNHDFTTSADGKCTHCHKTEREAYTFTYLNSQGIVQNIYCKNEVKASDTNWHDSTSNGTTENSGWYVVNSNVTIDGRVKVTGNVHLILADGCTLTVKGGISVSGSNALTIYAQSTGNKMGKLIVKNVGENNAGIGGNENGESGEAGGTVTINGGFVKVTSSKGAGIGGGYGGDRTVTGNTPDGTNGGAGGTVTINGGIVNASSKYGAGIGGGGSNIATTGGAGGTVTIDGGVVTATSDNGAGIGGGKGNTNGGAGTLNISGGKAVVFASSIAAKNNEANWSGVIFEGNSGKIYGTTVTPINDFTIESGKTLQIEAEKSLVISEKVTLTNKGTIENKGTLTNNGIIAIEQNGMLNNNSSSISNVGKIYVDGTLTGTVGGNIYYPLTLEDASATGATSFYNDNTYAKAQSTITLTPKTPEGNVFSQWIVSPNSVTIQNNAFIMPSEALRVTAQFSPTYDITYKLNGGTIGSGNVIKYTYGQGAMLPTNVTKAGYSFGGWYADSSFTGSRVTKISTTDTGDKVFYAKWIYIPPIDNTPTESFTSPVSNGNAIEIKARISDGVATVSEITTEAINKMLDNANSNGETKVDTIKIDLSGAKQEVKAITLSKKTLETLATAIASEDNDIDTVTIVLSKASIVLDSKTLEAVVKEAKGNDIKLVINDKAQSKLNTLQQNAIKKYHVATLFEAIFESNGKEIHNFNGGTATVTINFTPEEGKNMDYYHMVHISDDGVMTRFKTRYTKGKLMFTTSHFSDYAVIYDESEKNQTAIERPVPVTGLDAIVDKTTLTKKDATANIKVTVKPADATNKNVTYTSSNTKVAKVDKKGKVTAVANGTTTVTVKTVDGTFTKKIVIIVKIPDPMPTKAQIAANSVVLNSNATAKWTKENYLKLTWGKVTGAAGYEVYVRKCDGKSLWTKAAYTAKSGKTTSVTLKKLGGKKFSGAANYKYGVRAYKYVNGKKVYMGTTLTYHFVGSKNKKETNAKSVIAGKKAITLGVKKTTTLRTKLTKVNTSRRLVKHDTWIRYISSNPSVAKVDMRTGKVTGVKAGKCKIYCIALNGVKTTVSVTVK